MTKTLDGIVKNSTERGQLNEVWFKQDLEESLLAMLPEKKSVDIHAGGSINEQRKSYNQPIEEMENNIKQFCRGKETQ